MSTSKVFNAKDLAPDDIVAVICELDDDEPCCFRIPGINDVGIWLAKIRDICPTPGKPRGNFSMLGWFYWNDERDLTAPLNMRNNSEGIEFKEKSIVGIYEYDPNLSFDDDDVNEIREYIESIQ